MTRSPTRSKTAISAALAALAIVGAAGAAHAEPAKNIVLVHGAFVDGSGWRAVRDLLVKDGFNVSIVQQPLTGLAEDVAATRRVIDLQTGPVVLVGHSYGGTIITVAGADPKVKSLVYVAALMPDVGETAGQQLASIPAPTSAIQPTTDGFLFIDPARFAAAFAADLPKAEAEFLATSQMPVSASVFDAKATAAAWRDKPSYAVVANQDEAINPDLQRALYARARSKVTELKASHAVYASQPRAVADVIAAAARAAN